MKLMISTGRSSSRCQWVMSVCQVSLGRADSKRVQLERGRFWGWGVTEPRRRRTRWMVDSAGTGAPAWRRCQSMVRAPASRPSPARRLRQATISSSSTAEVRLAGTLGPRLQRRQGLLATGSVQGDVALHPGLGAPSGRCHRPDRASLDEHGVDAVLGQIQGPPQNGCPRIADTSCPRNCGTSDHLSPPLKKAQFRGLSGIARRFTKRSSAT